MTKSLDEIEKPDIEMLDESLRSNYEELCKLVEYTKHVESRLEAARRAMVRIANHLYGVEPNAISPQQIAQDALAAWERE
jgi:hypothetical protein